MLNKKVLSKIDLGYYKKRNPYSKDIIYDPKGQWKYPGQNTRIPGENITMQGVPYPVYAQPNVGQPQMMYPDQNYQFPGADYVDEFPQMKKGGRTKGLISMPKPSKKGLMSKKYSRSLDATNKLFTENYLFAKPKSKKNKVFDPNANYAKGGALLTKEVTCKKCGWQWDAADGGKDITTCHKCGGQGLLHAQNGGDTGSNGETYKYLGRPDSLYKKSLNGKWLISNKSTGNEFVSIEDPKGSRTKELDKNAVTVSSLNKKRRDHLSKLKKEMDFPKEFINLKDTRKVRATTGEKINPNVDLKADKYNKAIIDNIIKKAKAVGVDPSTMLAIALQETNFGKTDSNLGHVKKGYKGYPYSYIDFYKQKLNEAKFKDELLQIQYYNGLGTVYPETEEDYHGYEMQKIYGVPLPASGINMRKNPLYGKQIIDLRDNVILKNPYIQKALKQKQKGGDNTDAMTGMMKARLAYANEFGNPAAERMINLPDNPYQFDNGDTGSHYMASYDNYAVPQIQDENGVLQLGDYGPESNEAIRFDSDEDANYFAENYKDVSPGFIEADLNEDEIEEYRKGGYIVEEIDNYQKGGISKVSSNSSDNTRVNYQKPLVKSFNRSNNLESFYKKEREKDLQKQKDAVAYHDKTQKVKQNQSFGEFINQDVLGIPTLKEQTKQVTNDKKLLKKELKPYFETEKEIDQFISQQYSCPIASSENNWNDGPIQMVYPEKYLIGPGGGMIGNIKNLGKNTFNLGKKILSNPYVSGGLNAYFGAEGINEFSNPNSLTRKSMSRAYNNPTGSNIGDAAFDVSMNLLNFSRMPFNKAIKGSKNLINNTYKINPKAIKLGNYNRVVGPNAVADVNQSGLVRAGKYGTSGRPTLFPSFGKGVPNKNNVYAQKIIDQGKTPYIISTNRPMGVSTLGRHGKGTTQFPIDESGNYMPSFLANEAKIYNFKPHWRKGYQEVPKQYINGGTTNNYVDVDLTPEEIKDLIAQGYVIEELN